MPTPNIATVISGPCTAVGCTREALASGELCAIHDRLLNRQGGAPNERCLADCDRPRSAEGLCHTHYKRYRRWRSRLTGETTDGIQTWLRRLAIRNWARPIGEPLVDAQRVQVGARISVELRARIETDLEPGESLSHRIREVLEEYARGLPKGPKLKPRLRPKRG